MRIEGNDPHNGIEEFDTPYMDRRQFLGMILTAIVGTLADRFGNSRLYKWLFGDTHDKSESFLAQQKTEFINIANEPVEIGDAVKLDIMPDQLSARDTTDIMNLQEARFSMANLTSTINGRGYAGIGAVVMHDGIKRLATIEHVINIQGVSFSQISVQPYLGRPFNVESRGYHAIGGQPDPVALVSLDADTQVPALNIATQEELRANLNDLYVMVRGELYHMPYDPDDQTLQSLRVDSDPPDQPDGTDLRHYLVLQTPNTRLVDSDSGRALVIVVNGEIKVAGHLSGGIRHGSREVFVCHSAARD